MRIRVLNEDETRALIDPAAAIRECRAAYASLGRGDVEQPDVITIRVREHHGDVHAKGGYIHGTRHFSIKVATGFADNPKRDLPANSGAVWVFDAETGVLKLMILDNGFLTELRTGAAGAIAADLLARPEVDTVGIIGAGVQARYQLEALLQVRTPRRVLVWSRDQARARAFAVEARDRWALSAEAASSPVEAVRSSDLVITCTSSSTPIVMADWVRPGTHITAMGADMPHKQELDPALLARATVVPDRLSQCLTQGEIHHAVAAGLFRADQAHAELGAICAGLAPGRTRDDEITIADQTGVGVLDAAMANYIATRIDDRPAGRWLDA